MSKRENPTEIQINLLLSSDVTPAHQLSWLIRNFFCNVCSHDLKGAPRRVEALAVSLRMLNSAHESKSINFEEFQKISQEISDIEEHVYPGCSLI